MTDGLDQAVAQAGLDLLAADTGLTVHDGAVPAGAVRPYVLVYTTLDRPDSDVDLGFAGRSNVWVARWICHCVGDTAKAARGVAQRVRTQLLDVQPAVSGLSCGLIREEPAAPAGRDESLGYPVFDLIATYRLRATS